MRQLTQRVSFYSSTNPRTTQLWYLRIGSALLATELSVAVCGIHHLPGITVNPGWRQRKLEGYLHFSLPGVMQRLQIELPLLYDNELIMHETFHNKGLFAASEGNEKPGDSVVVCAFYSRKFKKLQIAWHLVARFSFQCALWPNMMCCSLAQYIVIRYVLMFNSQSLISTKWLLLALYGW